MNERVKKKPPVHTIEVSFKNGVFIDKKPPTHIFDETLRDFGIKKNDEIHIKTGEEFFDRAFALEIEELLLKLGFMKMQVIDHS